MIRHNQILIEFFCDPIQGEKEDFYETRRTDTYQGGSRSPPYEDRRYNERSSPGGRNFDERRSPGSDHENRQFGDFRKSPARSEVVNDWRREDRFGNGKRVEDGRLSDGDSKIGGRSPEQPNDLDASSPPMVRPVRDILGENVSPLRVIEPPKSSGTSKVADSSVHKQVTFSFFYISCNYIRSMFHIDILVQLPLPLFCLFLSG